MKKLKTCKQSGWKYVVCVHWRTWGKMLTSEFSFWPSWSCHPLNQSMKKDVLIDYILLPSNVDLYVIFGWLVNYSQWEVLYLWIIILWNEINKSIYFVWILFDSTRTLQYLYMLCFIFSQFIFFFDCNVTQYCFLIFFFLHILKEYVNNWKYKI